MRILPHEHSSAVYSIGDKEESNMDDIQTKHILEPAAGGKPTEDFVTEEASKLTADDKNEENAANAPTKQSEHKKNKGKNKAKTSISPKKSEMDQAINVLKENCATMTLDIHPTMLPALAPLTIFVINGVEEIQYNNVDCNHNTPDLAKGYEIMNNILDNPLHTDNKYEQALGGDVQFIALSWEKVCH